MIDVTLTFNGVDLSGVLSTFVCDKCGSNIYRSDHGDEQDRGDAGFV